VEAGAAVDAKNAPTAAWKTPERFSTSSHRQILGLSFSEGDISISLRTGTFLCRLDNSRANYLLTRIDNVPSRAK
jgi:hypothetical protein